MGDGGGAAGGRVGMPPDKTAEFGTAFLVQETQDAHTGPNACPTKGRWVKLFLCPSARPGHRPLFYLFLQSDFFFPACELDGSFWIIQPSGMAINHFVF